MKRIAFMLLLICSQLAIGQRGSFHRGHITSNGPRGTAGGQIGEGAPGWDYYRAITVNNSAGTASVAYPVRIAFNASDRVVLYSAGDGHDLRFTRAAALPGAGPYYLTPANCLPYWRESWNAADGYVVWVKFDTLAKASVTLQCYYGNQRAADSSHLETVFPAGSDFNTDWTSLPPAYSISDFWAIVPDDTIPAWPTDTAPARPDSFLGESGPGIYTPLDLVWPCKLFVSGYKIGSTDNLTYGNEFLARSRDCQTWTKWKNGGSVADTIIPRFQDVSPFIVGDSVFVVGELVKAHPDSAYRDIAIVASPQWNCTTWTAPQQIIWHERPYATLATNGWKDWIVAGPCVTRGPDTTLWMAYEGDNNGGKRQFGIAKAYVSNPRRWYVLKTDTVTWLKADSISTVPADSGMPMIRYNTFNGSTSYASPMDLEYERGTYYAFLSCDSCGGNLAIATSTDMIHWTVRDTSFMNDYPQEEINFWRDNRGAWKCTNTMQYPYYRASGQDVGDGTRPIYVCSIVNRDDTYDGLEIGHRGWTNKGLWTCNSLIAPRWTRYASPTPDKAVVSNGTMSLLPYRWGSPNYYNSIWVQTDSVYQVGFEAQANWRVANWKLAAKDKILAGIAIAVPDSMRGNGFTDDSVTVWSIHVPYCGWGYEIRDTLGNASPNFIWGWDPATAQHRPGATQYDTLSSALLGAFHTIKMSLMSAGAITVTYHDSVRASGTDSRYDATYKKALIVHAGWREQDTQGSADVQIRWMFVRPKNAVDPTVTFP